MTYLTMHDVELKTYREALTIFSNHCTDWTLGMLYWSKSWEFIYNLRNSTQDKNLLYSILSIEITVYYAAKLKCDSTSLLSNKGCV